MLASFPSVVGAFNNFDTECWWDNPSGLLVVTGQYSNQLIPGQPEYLPNYGNGIETARARWNSTPTKVIVSRGDWTSPSWFALYWAQDGNWGYTWWYCHAFYSMDHFDARVNTFYPETNDATLAASVFTHEVGHGLGLGHSTVANAVMNPYANRYIYMSPAQDDIDGLNYMYPR